ncbi:MAG: right-handed parallel beta-helix repeat-containing protein [archaeon]|nr:right-handed parallel beta-helix repeat-containing protein [archaeon]MCP8314335.1 right-handed parallel beta-helix repeat-containing protein [archaeon]
MKKIIGTITIAMLLMMPFLLMIPISVIAQPTMKLSDAVGGGTGGTFYLNPSILYTGGVTISGDTRIYGQGAMIDLEEESITVTDAYLYIERCVLTNGTDGGTDYYGALEFYDDASGFVYNNIIVDSDYDGIHIEDCDKYEIIIKENSILYSSYAGIYFEDSTDITILENIIKNNNYGIYGDNQDLMYDGDWLPEVNELHNILIKGNNIGVSFSENIYLEYVNGISIASNLIYSNFDGDGIELGDCPIVSITYNKIFSNYYYQIYYWGDDEWPIVDVDGTDVEVELSLTISYNKIFGAYYDDYGLIYAEYTQNVVITYNEMGGSYGYGIELYGYDEDFLMEPVLIAYNTIGYCELEQIYMDYVSDVSILFNKMTGGAYYAIEIYGEGYGEGLIIKGNVITDTFDYAMEIVDFGAPVIIEYNTILRTGYGIELHNCENPQIIYNTIMYSWDWYSLSLAGCVDGGRVAYNTIAYNTGYGIDIYVGCEGIVVEYNNVIGNSVYGIVVSDSDDITIQYNNIHNNYYDGIYWHDSSGLISNNIIGHTDGNLISGQWYGILISSTETTTISDNIIIGNYDGIYCSNSNPTIVRNYIANNVYGIYLLDIEGDDPDPTIGGSYDNRNYIIRNYADGIYINDEQSDPVINYNNIYGNVNYGINNWAADTVIDDAVNNWWGAIDGPGGVGPGSGDEVTDYVDYIPWLTAPIP